MDDETKKLSAYQKCRCGGEFALDLEKVGIAHTLPTCKLYDDMDVNELFKTPGAIAEYVRNMKWRPEA